MGAAAFHGVGPELPRNCVARALTGVATRPPEVMTLSGGVSGSESGHSRPTLHTGKARSPSHRLVALLLPGCNSARVFRARILRM
ncbi:hypothetical protein JCM4914_12220 [Streptomyces platensis subsp. malvinus]